MHWDISKATSVLAEWEAAGHAHPVAIWNWAQAKKGSAGLVIQPSKVLDMTHTTFVEFAIPGALKHRWEIVVDHGRSPITCSFVAEEYIDMDSPSGTRLAVTKTDVDFEYRPPSTVTPMPDMDVTPLGEATSIPTPFTKFTPSVGAKVRREIEKANAMRTAAERARTRARSCSVDVKADDILKIYCGCWDGNYHQWCPAAEAYQKNKAVMLRLTALTKLLDRAAYLPWTSGYFDYLRVTMGKARYRELSGETLWLADASDPNIQIEIDMHSGESLITAIRMFKDYYKATLRKNSFTENFLDWVEHQGTQPQRSPTADWCGSPHHTNNSSIVLAVRMWRALYHKVPKSDILLGEAYSKKVYKSCTACSPPLVNIADKILSRGTSAFDWSADIPDAS